jgi:hypothetical protein
MLRSILSILLLITLEAHGQLNCIFNTTPEQCTAMNGTANAMVTGGTPPYSYDWAPVPVSGQGTASIAGLASGNYDLTVTDDLGLQQTFNVVVPNDPSLGYMGSGTYAGAHAYTGFGVPCEGDCNGAMAMPAPVVSPGPFFYSWSDPSIVQIATTPQGDPVFLGFCWDQPYSYTVSDMSGCSSTGVPFTNPVVYDTMHWYVDQITAATCGNSDGSVTLAQDGNWPADLLVTDAGGTVVNSSNTGMGSHTVTGLAAGSYSAIFNYGSSACTSSLSFTMTAVGQGCGTVAGALYLDSDVDCTADAGEPGIAYRTMQVDPGAHLVITNADGSYAGGLADGSYMLTVLDPTVTPACPQSQPIPFVVNGNVTTLDIGAGSTSPMDLTVTAVNNAARPGFAHTVWAHVLNSASQPSATVELSCVLDNALTYGIAVPAPSSVNGNTLTWSLQALAPYASKGIQLVVLVGTQVVLGQQVNVAFSATNNGPEANTMNNTYTATRIITGSYDPNDKTAFTSTRQSETNYLLAQDEWIDYVIRFQNTGTDTAFTVVVVDTLEADLDMATYEQGAASHPFTVSFLPDRAVEWRFANILLPDSNTNEALSHGAVSFRIRPALPLAVGTVLSNAADIFVDFNAPIRTNTSELVAAVSTGWQAQGQGQGQVFPNPAQDHITLSASGTALQHVRFLALDGRTVLQQQLTGERADVDISSLPAGSYLVSLTGEDGRVMQQRVLVL